MFQQDQAAKANNSYGAGYSFYLCEFLNMLLIQKKPKLSFKLVRIIIYPHFIGLQSQTFIPIIIRFC